MTANQVRHWQFPYGKGYVDVDPDRYAPVDKQVIAYACPRGHGFTRPFAPGATPPGEWDCPQHGERSAQPGRVLASLPEPLVETRPNRPKTSWAYLVERRSDTDLHQLLDEALAKRAAARADGNTT